MKTCKTQLLASGSTAVRAAAADAVASVASYMLQHRCVLNPGDGGFEGLGSQPEGFGYKIGCEGLALMLSVLCAICPHYVGAVHAIMADLPGRLQADVALGEVGFGDLDLQEESMSDVLPAVMLSCIAMSAAVQHITRSGKILSHWWRLIHEEMRYMTSHMTSATAAAATAQEFNEQLAVLLAVPVIAELAGHAGMLMSADLISCSNDLVSTVSCQGIHGHVRGLAAGAWGRVTRVTMSVAASGAKRDELFAKVSM